MALIFLVRHGQTDFIGKILCGNLPGIHLNEEGRSQAQKAANYLGKQHISAIYSSPMERARETASALAQPLGKELITQEFLREVNFGDFQGKDSEYLLAHPVWQKFIEKPSETEFPNGESVLKSLKRVDDGLISLARTHKDDDKVVCFAHCEILLLAVCACLNLSPDYMHRLTINPASISLVEWTNQTRKLHLLDFMP